MSGEKTFGDFLEAVRGWTKENRFSDADGFLEDLDKLYSPTPEMWQDAKVRPFNARRFWDFSLLIAACYKRKIWRTLSYRRLIMTLEESSKLLKDLYKIAEQFGLERWEIEIEGNKNPSIPSVF